MHILTLMYSTYAWVSFIRRFALVRCNKTVVSFPFHSRRISFFHVLYKDRWDALISRSDCDAVQLV